MIAPKKFVARLRPDSPCANFNLPGGLVFRRDAPGGGWQFVPEQLATYLAGVTSNALRPRDTSAGVLLFDVRPVE